MSDFKTHIFAHIFMTHASSTKGKTYSYATRLIHITHGSFTHETWLLHEWNATHSYHKWLCHTGDMTPLHKTFRRSLWRMTLWQWQNSFMCNATHLYRPWLFHTGDMTPSCDTWLIHIGTKNNIQSQDMHPSADLYDTCGHYLHLCGYVRTYVYIIRVPHTNVDTYVWNPFVHTTFLIPPHPPFSTHANKSAEEQRWLQDVAVCCSVLQGVAVCCRVLQSVAECCRVL